MTSLPPIRTKADIISSSTALALHDPALAPYLWHTHAGYYAPYTASSRVESMQGGMGGMVVAGVGWGMMNPMMMVSQTAFPFAGAARRRERERRV
jgi:hypothetical protein